MDLNPAQQLMARGHHCSEGVLMAFCQELGIKNDLIPRIATPLAGGMAGAGEVCGAVVGALMCIGIKHGRDEVGQPEDKALQLAGKFLRAFHKEMGSLRCRDLTGIDLTTPEGLAQFRGSDVPVKVCLRAGGFAYETVLRLLQEPAQGSAGG
jgi:C_GCAxxG_C_C family probable redox protein